MIRLCMLALCLMASSATAQTTSPGAGSTFAPGDPGHTRPVEYRSIFSTTPTEPPGGDWRQANEEMGRLRGHAGQLREGPAPAPAAADTPSPAPAPAAHQHKH